MRILFEVYSSGEKFDTLESNIMKAKLFLSSFLISVFLFGCQTATETSRNAEVSANAENTKVVLTEKGVFNAEMKTDPPEIKAGEKTELAFYIKNSSGELVKDLQIVHEKPMHLLIVSDDLDEFYHEHPAVQSDGSYKVPFIFPNGGGYKLYTDFTPPESKQVVHNFSVNVGGSQRAAKPLIPDAKPENTVENLRVEMKPDGDFVSGREMMISFNVTDAATNQQVTDLENYLGEKAHFVVVSQDLQQFVHAHPMSGDNVKENVKVNAKENAKENEAHTHDASSAHGDKTGKMMNPNGASIVSAHVTFPKASVYRLWAQFKRGGKVVTVPFTIDVKQGQDQKAVDLTNVKIPEGAFKIVVSREGFTPQEVSFKKGQPLKLAFYRADEVNCGSEVIFKDLNITKKLPVGEVVTIDIPTDKAGEFAFACGMDMLKGKIIVQ